MPVWGWIVMAPEISARPAPADVEHDRREATEPSAQPKATNGNRGERAGITSASCGPANRQLVPGLR